MHVHIGMKGKPYACALHCRNSYWPIVWPCASRKRPSRWIWQECSLDLPVRSRTGDEIDPCALRWAKVISGTTKPLQSKACARTGCIGPLHESQPEQGEIVQESFDDFGAARDLGHGMESRQSCDDTLHHPPR